MYYLDKDVLEREVLACFIPLRCSPEAVNCEVRQQYQLQTHEDDEPILTHDELAGFVRQSMSLDLSEFLEVPAVSEPEPTQRSASPRKKHPAPSPEQTLSELLAIAHSENITDWIQVIARFMAVRRKATLAELVQELKMPLVEVWMGLLMDGQYQLARAESEEEFYVSNFTVKLS